jgi:hypothetical protein
MAGFESGGKDDPAYRCAHAGNGPRIASSFALLAMASIELNSSFRDTHLWVGFDAQLRIRESIAPVFLSIIKHLTIRLR